MNNKEIFLHLCNFLNRTKSPNIKIELFSSCLSIYWAGSIFSKIKYDEITDKITYWTINNPNAIKNVDLDDCNYLYYISNIPYSAFKNLKKLFNLLVNCNFI